MRVTATAIYCNPQRFLTGMLRNNTTDCVSFFGKSLTEFGKRILIF